MYIDPHEFLESIAEPLGWFYVGCCALNVTAAWRAWRHDRGRARVLGWAVVAVVFGVLGGLSLAGRPVVLAEGIKDAVDAMINPVSFTLGSFAALAVFYLGRRWFAIPAVAFAVLNASLLWMGLSMTDPEFAAIVTKPDNVPIVAMVYLLGFFTWLGAYQAVENDPRLDQGEQPIEKDYSQKVLVWPDLVYTELICMVLVTVVLVVWSLSLTAPLEQPANPVVTPNPSKAPWYFLGLQEMLLYSDPWNVGVVVPCLIIFGLMAIPYLDVNPDGSGYYSIRRRRFAYVTFQFGFLQLWILLILIGTFMRGPNWSFFSLYEVRDPHKLAAVANVKLSEAFWADLLGRGVPQVPAAAGMVTRAAYIAWREIAGLVLLAVYFLAIPPILGRTWAPELRSKMGRGRFTLMVVLWLLMLTLPIKMLLRWAFGLSYVVSVPEWFLNI